MRLIQLDSSHYHRLLDNYEQISMRFETKIWHISSKKNAFENFVCKMVAILSPPQRAHVFSFCICITFSMCMSPLRHVGMLLWGCIWFRPIKSNSSLLGIYELLSAVSSDWEYLSFISIAVQVTFKVVQYIWRDWRSRYTRLYYVSMLIV